MEFAFEVFVGAVLPGFAWAGIKNEVQHLTPPVKCGVTGKSQQIQAEERMALAAMKLQGMSPRSIASALQRSSSTLSRELTRNCSGGAYVCRDAQARCDTLRAKPDPRSLIPMGLCGPWSRTCWVGCGRRSKSRGYMRSCGPRNLIACLASTRPSTRTPRVSCART